MTKKNTLLRVQNIPKQSRNSINIKAITRHQRVNRIFNNKANNPDLLIENARKVSFNRVFKLFVEKINSVGTLYII